MMALPPMAHEILIATFPTTVPTVGTTGIDARRPYFNMKNVQLDNPSLSYISIEDDEERYDYLSAASGNRIETMQNPTVPLDFGGANGTVAVTESMSATSGSIVVDSAGNRFVMMWPAKYNLETALTQEIGNRMVLLIFPVGVAQSDGTTFGRPSIRRGQSAIPAAMVPRSRTRSSMAPNARPASRRGH
ncbi:hypothetical protein QWZ10_11675 [Paracoccus cavernae]|uniref:DUF1254 domain-containing protein n=1 Tax=Paracoccus cavernae TaxID=1571207 RepID=A0ABT8D7C4_9RHOB|nr:hypothetical protein [Paracoccus cavernae]